MRKPVDDTRLASAVSEFGLDRIAAFVLDAIQKGTGEAGQRGLG